MKIKTMTMVSALLLAQSTMAAEERGYGQVGLSSFATVVATNIDGADNDELVGLGIFGDFAATDNFGARTTYARLEHNDTSDIEADVFELSVLGGTGLATQGFKAYGSVGFFDENWEFDTFRGDFEEDFNGIMGGAGLGYNWRYVGLDLSFNLRDPSDYEDFIEETTLIDGDVVAVSASLGIAARF